MASLILELPDEVIRGLEGIAPIQHKSVQQLAVERLSSRVVAAPDLQPGAPASLLIGMRESPRLDTIGVDEIDAAIAAGRLPVRGHRLF